MRVGYSSRSRVAVEWYDNEAEAEARAERAKREPGVEAANLGIIQVGRATSFDRTVDSQRQYAVVTP